ncbi:MAG: 16S rRNA (adenine(1518)-N(6)/adenine(1519)-N(6))-dimethyltransferase RsmA [Treponema sp.]|jgi:16S rRNA (adenine1518-N6/adenine1519-N6)-dimethyltransferase|nr:16S rRNA (adenine(1518)-N(6)/adenine(1519)-N(6))-dimethyltransferase RsmA [Treponema sp.]
MDINYDSARFLKVFLEERQLGMRKKYGQNFLINGRIRERLVNSLEAGEGEEVWEIGPGLGAMTGLLLARGMKVRAFEIDPGFQAVLRECFGDRENFSLVGGDVLKTWPVCPPAPLLLGNLPYTIGAVLLGNFIERGRFFRRMVVTVQKETADRMIALPGSAAYSSLSVLCGSVYKVSPLLSIHRSSFYPVPHVDSRGVLLDIRGGAGGPSFPPLFYPLIRSLFSSRRKMIKNTLSDFVSSRIIGGAEAEGEDPGRQALAAAGLRGDERPDNLGVEEFLALAEALGAWGEGGRALPADTEFLGG